MLDVGLAIRARRRQVEGAGVRDECRKIGRHRARPAFEPLHRSYCSREPRRCCSALTDGVKAMSEAA